MRITAATIKRKVDVLTENSSVMPATIADELGTTEKEVVKHLPGNISTEAKCSEIETMWNAMTFWKKVTAIISNSVITAEVKRKLSKGITAQGYFSLFDNDAPLNGHIETDRIDSIFFVSKPFLTLRLTVFSSIQKRAKRYFQFTWEEMINSISLLRFLRVKRN
ncbi:MAG: hypothetical protein KAR40_10605 [Candidatus Sabulitectum sp.]|nr:hypothetical protein [Candidatus Sabulitectum sp.]